MRKIAAFVVLIMVASCAAQEAKPLYRETARWTVGGEGFWDYLRVDGDGARLYVAHGTKIEVVDTATGKVIGTMPSNGAHGVALVPEKNLGFYSNGRSGTVTMFEIQSLTTKGEIKVGEGPDAAMYDAHSGKVLVMNGRSKELSVIDPETQKVVATVALGGSPEEAATDEGHVYVNVADTAEIAVVDPKSWKVTSRWKLKDCEDPSGLAIDEKGGRLFSVCGNKKMVVVETKSGTELATLPIDGGADGAGFDAGLGRAVSSNGSGSLTVVEKREGKYVVAGTVPTQRGARTMALDAKSHRVYTATAELGPPAEGSKRPSIKPGTFVVIVYEPVK